MSSSAQQTFRSQLSGFRWANSVQDDSPSGPAASASSSANPFSRAWTGISGYIPLRNEGRSQEEEAYFALSRWERFIGFLACCAGGMACFGIAFLFLPILALKPRKFALAFTLGSCLFMMGFAILHGPWNHLKHIFSAERLPFSLAYFGSLALTLFFAIGVRSTIGTLVAAIIQDAGELIVWRDALLALGYGWDDVYINHPDTSVKELYIRSWIRDPEYLRRGETLWSEPVRQSPTFPRHWGEISKRVKRLETAFRSRPARIKHVRRLTVEPTPFPDRLEWVAGEVLPYIEQLDLDLFGPLQGGRALAEDLVRDFCDFLKTKEDRSAARLRRVQLKLSGCPMLVEEIVAEVLRLGPNITELSLGSTPRDMAPITEIHPDLWSKVDLPSLSSLLCFWQDNRLAVLVQYLIQKAPNIEEYTYCDDFPTDTINDGDPPPRAVTKSLARVRNFLHLRWIADLCYCR